MNHGSLFSGIGGFDLAAEKMGWNNVFHCEIEPFPRKVLNYYWPNAKSYEDIKTTDFTIHRGQIDVLTGGFPCQPYSLAGSRKGKEDDRHLWPEMLRAIRECRPTWIVGENVPGIISWNGGLVFEEMCIDLENEGYEVQPIVLPAASKDAPHKRDRVWFVAYSGGERWNDRRNNRKERQLSNNINRNAEEGEPKRNRRKRGSGQIGEVRDVADTNSTRLQKTRTEQQTAGIKQYGELDGNASNAQCQGLERENRDRMGKPTQFAEQTTSNSDSIKRPKGRCDTERSTSTKRHVGLCDSWADGGAWQDFPTQPPICGGDDGIPPGLDGITFSKWRNESIKAYGNAVVPQVVMQIFRVIEKMNAE